MAEELKDQITGEADPPKDQPDFLFKIITMDEYREELKDKYNRDKDFAKMIDSVAVPEFPSEEEKDKYAEEMAKQVLADRNAYAAFDQKSDEIFDEVTSYKEMLSAGDPSFDYDNLYEKLRVYLSVVNGTILPLASTPIRSIIEKSDIYKSASSIFSELQEKRDLKPYLERVISSYNKNHPDSPVLTSVNEILFDKSDAFFDDLRKKAKTRQKQAAGRIVAANRFSNAEAENAILSLGDYVITPSVEEYMHALTGKMIFELPGKYEDFAFDSSGKLNSLSLQGKSLLGHPNIETAYLAAIVKYVAMTDSDENSTISFYAPGLLQAAKIDPRSTPGARDNTPLPQLRQEYILQNFVNPLDSLVMQMQDGSCYRLAGFVSYDIKTEKLTLSVPAFFKLKEELEEAKGVHYNRLFHATILNEGNTMAVELANRILNGVLQRGVRADYNRGENLIKKTTTTKNADGTTKKVIEEFSADQAEQEEPEGQKEPSRKIVYAIKCSTLIKDCPQMLSRLAEIDADPDPKKNKSQLKTNVIQRAFAAATRIIMEKSDAPKRYIDFKINYTPPTQRTLSTKYVVSHKGKNNDYSPPVQEDFID